MSRGSGGSYNVYALALLLIIILPSCADEPVPEESAAVADTVTAPVMTKTVEKPVDAKEVEKPKLVVPERDPFKTFIVTKTPTSGDKPRGPLEKYDINMFKVKAVMSGFDEPTAMILAPDAKTYYVKIGDFIGTRGGEIVKIEDRGIVVRELFWDDSGNVSSSKEIKLSLPKIDSDIFPLR